MTQTAPDVESATDLGLRRFGRVLRAIGLVGVLAGVIATATGLWLLHDLDATFGRSLALTAESLSTVDASLVVATDAVAVLGDGLARAEQTSQGLNTTLDDGANLLDETGVLLRGDVASAIESVEGSLPGLIQVGGTIDSTLRAFNDLPVGVTYEPEQPFDESLQELQDDLDGLSDDLRDQAETVEAASDNLRAVGDQSDAVAQSIGDVRESLDQTEDILAQYRAAATDASDLIDETTADLDRRLLVLQILVVVLGVVYCIGQILPLFLGNRLAGLPAPADHDDDVMS